jgi:hypothetical protein
MAKGEIRIKVDEFFTASRVEFCLKAECRFHSRDGFDCGSKRVALDENGKCIQERKKEWAAKVNSINT